MNPPHEEDRQKKTPLYPEIDQSIPNNPFYPANPNPSSSANNLFPQYGCPVDAHSPSAPPEATEEILIRVGGAILNLIDKSYSVELACGDLTVVRIVQGQNIVAVLACVADEIQWPLTKTEVATKVDRSHYFFSLRPPKEPGSDSENEDEILNYGLTIVSKGQEKLMEELERILTEYCCYTEQRMSEKAKEKGEEVLSNAMVVGTSPEELKGEKKEAVEGQCAAYWTTLAPNVEEYSGRTAQLIATGSGQLIRGILWCGDVTMERIKRGNDVLKNRLSRAEKEKEISPDTLRRIQRVKRVTKMTEKVANGVLSGVVKVSGFFTSSVANSKAGKKFFGLLPGEIVLASLDGFGKICDAVEVAGKNVMSTSSTVTTELVDHRQ
ncbi:PREDICTED: senescence/dehydration-associated protein At3g51250 isoform X2 [Tarenaya hassleriana]|uniref:senescence/dehydration-associated protein At3g51250 isoform X2 n=1 Tax=Tarenaya hassleriana TaxID=28532 RepID=UPI00053C19EA|nr:PREDICTED: senescence/dehydration-associated protein At3g51250 isoform X2 [Tarenaya hassleriana]